MAEVPDGNMLYSVKIRSEVGNMSMKRLLLSGPFVLLLSVFALSSVQAQTQTALIYTSVPQNVIDVIEAEYERANPGYQLDVFRGGTSAVLSRIAAEREGGGIAADLIWVADPSEIITLKNEDLLTPHTSAETEALPEAYRDADDMFFAGRVLGIVIAYNTAVLSAEEYPTTWRDLLGEAFSDMSGFPTPENSGASMVTVGALMASDDFGEEFLEQLGENGMRQVRNNGDAAQMVATGELAAAIGLDFQIRALMAEGSPVDYVYPEDGAVFIPSPIAIFADAPNPDAAKHFVDFILSQEGQQVLVREANFIPTRPDVEGPEGSPAEGLSTLDIDPIFISENRERILEVFNSTMQR